MADFNEMDFYRINYLIAKGWPQVLGNNDVDLQYKRLNTFATVDSEPEILGEQIAKDERWKGKEIFFSRPWAESGETDRLELKKMLPALLAWEDYEIEARSERPFARDGFEIVPIRLGFFDRYVEKFDPGVFDETKGQQRTKEEVKRDLRELRDKHIAELAKFSRYKLTFPSGGIATDWFSSDHVLAMKGAGTIESYQSLEPLKSRLSTEPVPSPVVTQVTTDGLVVAYYLALLKIPRCEPSSITISYEDPADPNA